MTIKLLLALTLCTSFCTGFVGYVNADSNGVDDMSSDGYFFDHKSDGWFWYKDPPVVKNKKELKPKLTPNTAESQKPEEKTFSVAWLRKNLPILRDRAIDDPSVENVSIYMYAQKVLLDKAQNFAEKAQQVVRMDPVLDENNRDPHSTYARQAFLFHQSQASEEGIKYLVKKGGFFFFFGANCSVCRAEIQIVKNFHDQYGYYAKYISVDGTGIQNVGNWVPDNGIVKKLHLIMTPTTVFVVPPNNYYIISQGAMSMDEMKNRLLTIADEQKMLPKDLQDQINPYSKGVITPDQFKQFAKEGGNVSSTQLVNEIRKDANENEY